MTTNTNTDFAFLAPFRQAADAMLSEPTDWQWVGKYTSERHFGITKSRALAFQEKYGGEARRM